MRFQPPVLLMGMLLLCTDVAALAEGEPGGDHAQVATEKESTTPAPATNLLGLPAAPLTEPIITDRPDFTESPFTVPYGHVQLETGYTFTYDSGDGERNMDHTYPENLLRIGLIEDLELRVGWLGWSHSSRMYRERNDEGRRLKLTEHENGATDMSLGFKVFLAEQKEWRPNLSMIVDASLPVGSRNKTSGDVDPGAKLLWGYDLTDELTLSGNLNVAVPTSENGRFFQTAASVSLGYALTDRVGAYVEYFGMYPNDRNTNDAHYANTGMTFLVTNDFQIDVRTGMGLNDEADDLFAGIGFSFRW